MTDSTAERVASDHSPVFIWNVVVLPEPSEGHIRAWPEFFNVRRVGVAGGFGSAPSEGVGEGIGWLKSENMPRCCP
jgi:hypothetical protein